MPYSTDSAFADHILYRMCSDYPSNDDPEVIGGKLWLIGRVYAAPVERRSGPNLDWEPLKDAMATSSLDRELEACRAIGRIDLGNLRDVLRAHKTLTNIFRDTTRREKRALASKYLHFHAPSAFFIYDAAAAKQVRKAVCLERSKGNPDHDEAYEAFCLQCLEFRDTVLEPSTGSPASPRDVDSALLARARNALPTPRA